MSLPDQHAEDMLSEEDLRPAISRLDPPTPAIEQDSGPSRRRAADDFAEFLRNTIPTALIPRELFSFLYRESRTRLDMAKAAGVDLGELTIGEDCLPTWPDLHWDPNSESLHAAIQDRLIDFQAARDLGDLVQRDIVAKGNSKLDRARELGVQLVDIVIGLDLLPTWDHVQEGGDENDEAFAVEDDDSAPDSDIMDSQMDIFSLVDDSTMITPVTDVFDSDVCSLPRSGSPLTCDSDVDSGSDGPIYFDDVILLDNLVSPQPIHEDGDGANIVYGVDVVGGPARFCEVDLEVYLALDDDDVADLPEVELSIDRAGFEHHYGDVEAVDVEVPGTVLFCFDAIEEAASDAEWDEDKGPIRPTSPRTLHRECPLPLFDVEEVTEDDGGSSSTHSEEVTTDDDDDDDDDDEDEGMELDEDGGDGQ